MFISLANLTLFLLAYATWSTSHPFLMAQLLVLFALSTTPTLWSAHSLWACTATIMVFLGGVMVMILYISSIMNNAKPQTISLKWPALLAFPLFLTPASLSLSPDAFLFSPYFYLTFFFLIAYLTIALITTLKNVQTFSGALKA